MPVCAVAMTPLPIVMWPGHADLARRASRRPRSSCCRRCRPARRAARSGRSSRRGRSAPGCRSCVPAPIRVSPTAGRSIAVCAPISTSSSIDHAADLRNLVVGAVGPAREAEAVAADARRRPARRRGRRSAPARESTRARGGRSRRRSARAGRSRRADRRSCARRSPRRRRPPRTDRRTRPSPSCTPSPSDRESDARRRAGASGRRRARPPGEREIRLRVAQHRARRRLGRRPRMTAEARVARSSWLYFGLVKKVRSPGPASSMPATRWISISPSPSRRQPRRSAISLSFNTSQYTTTVRAGRRVGGFY